jgi:ABC-type glycerol-3-phosphate transport system substrate-binding protein
MRKASILFVVLAALAAVVLAATAQAKPKAAAESTVTLSGWSSSPEENDLLQQVISTFEKTHPSIKVDYSVINGDYATAMTARFAAHNPPDVFYVDSSVLAGWAKQGVLQPLNSYIKSSKYNTKAFYPNLLNAFKVGGQVYGFPKDWSPLAMEINTAMLSQAKQKRPTTWAQLQSVAHDEPSDAKCPKPPGSFGTMEVERTTRTSSSQALAHHRRGERHHQQRPAQGPAAPAHHHRGVALQRQDLAVGRRERGLLEHVRLDAAAPRRH